MPGRPSMRRGRGVGRCRGVLQCVGATVGRRADAVRFDASGRFASRSLETLTARPFCRLSFGACLACCLSAHCAQKCMPFVLHFSSPRARGARLQEITTTPAPRQTNGTHTHHIGFDTRKPTRALNRSRRRTPLPSSEPERRRKRHRTSRLLSRSSSRRSPGQSVVAPCWGVLCRRGQRRPRRRESWRGAPCS